MASRIFQQGINLMGAPSIAAFALVDAVSTGIAFQLVPSLKMATLKTSKNKHQKCLASSCLGCFLWPATTHTHCVGAVPRKHNSADSVIRSILARDDNLNSFHLLRGADKSAL